MLLREHRRRDEHQHLLAVDGDGERRADGDLRLAEADVAADEPVHRMRRLEILHHGFDRGSLVVGLAVRELALEALDPFVLDVVRHAGLRLALGVELQQLTCQLAQVRPSARLEVVPRLAAELRERGRLRVGADVAADLSDLLVRDVDTVVAAEGEQQVVARDAGDFLRLETLELRDPVVLVHDVVARSQVGEALQRPPGRRRRTRRALAKDLRVGEQREPELAPDEAAAGRRDRERQALGRLPGLEQARLGTAEQRLLPQRLSPMREGDDEVEFLAQQAVQLVLGLRQPARGERRALGVERERLALGQPGQFSRTLERDRRQCLLLPDGPHFVGRPDEIGWLRERRDEVGRHADRLVAVGKLDLHELTAPLGGGIDRR